MILCNGAPSSGTDLPVQILTMMGFKYSGVLVEDYGEGQRVYHSRPGYPRGAIPIGQDVVVRGHIVPDRPIRAKHRVLHVIRDPRASAVSNLRSAAVGAEIEEPHADLIELISRPIHGHPNWVALQAHFAEQGNVSHVMLLRYENLLSSKAIADIAAFCEVVSFDPAGILDTIRGKKLPPRGSSPPLSQVGGPKHWQDWWTPEVEQAWQDNGGDALLQRLGYA